MSPNYNIEQIRANPLNRFNGMHVPELIRYAEVELTKATELPEKTNEQKLAKQSRIEAAKQILEERKSKLKMYQEAFPDLY